MAQEMAQQERRSRLGAAREDARRLSEITRVMTRYGLREALHWIGVETEEEAVTEDVEALGMDAPTSTLARRLRRVLEDLGPTSIKLGQILSTRPDILAPSIIEELRLLQDRAPEIPFEQIQMQVEDTLGRPLEELFEHVEREPLATASMAQVHRARMFDGREVIIKVQRPGIGRLIRSDMSILYYLARLGEATIDEVGLYNPVAIVKEFEKAITEELNFLIEAENTKTAHRLAADLPDVIIPEVLDDYTGARVITQTYIEGFKIEELEVGSERAQKLCTIAMDAAFRQIFRDGFFHGDPHPGNMLITADDRVVFLDWGLVGRLSAVQQDQLVEMLFTIANQDLDGITRMILRMGAPEGRVSLRALRAEIERMYGEHMRHEHLQDINVTAVMEDIMDVAHKYRIRMNPEYALLTKATATVEGVLRTVHPELDVLETLKPYGQELMVRRLSGERMARAVASSVVSANHLLRELPLQLDQILMDVEGGEFRVQVAHPQIDQLGPALNTLGSRIFLGFLSGALIVGGCILMTTFDWRPRGIPMLLVFASVCFLSAGGFAFMALSWHFVRGGSTKLRVTPFLNLFRRK